MSGSVTARVSGLGNEFELNPVFVQSTQTPLLGRMDFMKAWSVLINDKEQKFTLTLLD